MPCRTLNHVCLAGLPCSVSIASGKNRILLSILQFLVNQDSKPFAGTSFLCHSEAMASGTGWIRPPWYEKYSLLWFSEDLGVKREELTETLWNKYNEVPFPIQSLDAFHCDALAASRQAKDVDEFHTLMEATKKQRLQEFGYCAFDTRMILGRNSHSDQSLLGPTKTLVTTASLEAIIDTATSILGGVEAKKPLELG